MATAIVSTLGTGAFAQEQNQPPRGKAQYQGWLANEVRHQLVLIPWLSIFDNLQYRVDRNNVTLSGQVTDPVIKDEAQKAAKGIEGVGQITNNIEVLPLSPRTIKSAERNTAQSTGFHRSSAMPCPRCP